MEFVLVSTADGMLGSTNDTKAPWDDAGDGQITARPRSLLNPSTASLESSRAFKLFWFNDWVKSLSL
jgi:hypothetical protein